MTSPTERLNTALAGRYRIERHLGEGGMATVYLAEDLKHERKVALKLLKPELAAVLGADRFVQEIKTTAALQHPHILPLFDSGSADGFLFYVMPFIDGETLRDKLNRETQLGVEEAVRIARDVADALDYAHRHGVIHRDIKPENILLHDGRPMVADFGIALAVSAAAGGRMTETGLSLGTPHYMSPEQATAEKEITARSDVYSLGSVLYEMLTGNPPHTGASAQQIIMKIITEPAEAVTKYRKAVPANVAAAVAKALEKLPADRFESAKAFADALANPMFASMSATGMSAGAMGGRGGVSMRLFAGVAVLAAALLATTVWGWLRLPHVPPAKRTRFSLMVPDSVRIRPDVPNQNFTISPDGSQIVYLGGVANLQTYVRSLNEFDAKPIPDAELARNARFSPDSKWLAFTQGGQLKKVLMQGGPAVPIADSAGPASWGDRDVLVFMRAGALWRVNASGGAPSLVAKPDTAKGRSRFSWPWVLPGGKAVLFDIVTGGDNENGQLAAARLDDGKVIPLGLTGRNPRYVASGHIVFGRHDGTVLAASFDAERLRVTGPAVTVLENVYIKSGGATEFGVAQDGTLFFVPANSERELLVLDRSGAKRALRTEKRRYASPRYSPTSGRVAFQMYDRSSSAKADIWVYNDLTRTDTRLTTDGNSAYPAWMADGERVVWMTRDSSGTHVWRQRWDGTGRPESLFGGERDISYVVPSHAGSRFAVVKYGSGGYDLYVADGDQPSSLRPLVVTSASEGAPQFSPDGQWVSYASNESGQAEVYVIAASGDGGRHQISAAGSVTWGGIEAVWAPDGTTLYYVAGQSLMAVRIATSPAFTVTSREIILKDCFSGVFRSGLDVSRDGRSFLMTDNRNEVADRIVVVTGWLDELKERMAQAAKK